MTWTVTIVGAAFILLSLLLFGRAVQLRRRGERGAPLGGDRGVGGVAIFTFLGFGLIALGSLLFVLGLARLTAPDEGGAPPVEGRTLLHEPGPAALRPDPGAMSTRG